MVDQEPGANQNIKQFTSIEKIDTGILYALELTSSISVLLLAFGLIASMANVLTQGSVLTENLLMQRIWAWTQCVAIDASVAGTIIRTFRYHIDRERVKTWLYGFLSALLLFTAAIVSNIESVQQTLNIALDRAYLHVFVPVEALIWIRSIAIVLLIVAHALRHVHTREPMAAPQSELVQPTAPSLVLTPEVVETLRVLLAQTTVSEEDPTRQALPEPKHEEQTRDEPATSNDAERGKGNFERVRQYLADHPDAKVREVAKALAVSVSTANKWMIRVRGECSPRE
jgi:DNA-directed RNA polymerase specialized sigma24 family protein